MKNFSERAKLEFGTGVVVIVVGVFFTILAIGINPNAFDPIGPRLFPLSLALILLAGGVLLCTLSLIQQRQGNGNGADLSMPDGYGFGDSNLRRIVYVVAAGASYLLLFIAFGYFTATLIAMLLILLAFGNRRPMLLIALPVLAAVLYQFVFMGLMNLNDPKGTLIDLRPLSNWISGA